MSPNPRLGSIALLLAMTLLSEPALASDQHGASWSVKKHESDLCIAQNPHYKGLILETKKLTIPVRDMGELQAYRVTINDKVVIPVSKPNLVDTSCNCIRVRDMDVLKTDEVNLRIDGVTHKDIDVSIKMQIKGMPLAMEQLQADQCRKPQKIHASLSMRQ